MSNVSMPVTRPIGKVLVVGHPSGRGATIDALVAMGYDCGLADDPYSAMAEIAARRSAFSGIILSLAGMFREELSLIWTVKRRFPHLEIWLTHTDGRAALLAEAMRLGADGLLAEDGLHRIASPARVNEPAYAPIPTEPANLIAPSMIVPPRDGMRQPEPVIIGHGHAMAGNHNERHDALDDFDQDQHEPVLTAEELKALLQDHAAVPPNNAET